jgi:hypothetical protein
MYQFFKELNAIVPAAKYVVVVVTFALIFVVSMISVGNIEIETADYQRLATEVTAPEAQALMKEAFEDEKITDREYYDIIQAQREYAFEQARNAIRKRLDSPTN